MEWAKKNGIELPPPPPPEELAERAAKTEADIEATILEEAINRAWKDTGIPKLHFQHVVAATPDSTPALTITREWYASKKTFLVMLGGVGSGKTGAAVWTVREAEEQYLRRLAAQYRQEITDQPRSYNTVEEIPRWLRESFGSHRAPAQFIEANKLGRLAGFGDENEEAWEKLENTPLLIIDDFGSEFADQKGWFDNAFQSLTNTRYAESRATIITSNLSLENFKARAGERFLDRLRESGIVKEVGGKSLRPEMGKKPDNFERESPTPPVTKSPRNFQAPQPAIPLGLAGKDEDF